MKLKDKQKHKSLYKNIYIYINMPYYFNQNKLNSKKYTKYKNNKSKLYKHTKVPNKNTRYGNNIHST